MPFQFRKEAIEEDLNSNFPSQGQGNPPLYYSLSEVVVPTYSINNVAEGTSLPQNLQTAWDFSTGNAFIATATTTTLINNTGFWQVDVNCALDVSASAGAVIRGHIDINDGLANKRVWSAPRSQAATSTAQAITENKFVVFLRSGDSLTATSAGTGCAIAVWYRQIADVNGNLVNPLGFSFA